MHSDDHEHLSRTQPGAVERVQIFIDGANFYLLALQKAGIRDAEFGFDAFASFLAAGREITPHGKRYYIGTVREQLGDLKSKKAMSRQTSLFTTLTKTGWHVGTSKLRKRVETIPVDGRVAERRVLEQHGIASITYERFREKGIDVKMATDLIVGAVDDQYTTAIVVSSDADLVPAIDWIRNRLGKKVEYIGFSIPNNDNPAAGSRPTMALVARTDAQRVLAGADLIGLKRQEAA